MPLYWRNVWNEVFIPSLTSAPFTSLFFTLFFSTIHWSFERHEKREWQKCFASVNEVRRRRRSNFLSSNASSLNQSVSSSPSCISFSQSACFMKEREGEREREKEKVHTFVSECSRNFKSTCMYRHFYRSSPPFSFFFFSLVRDIFTRWKKGGGGGEGGGGEGEGGEQIENEKSDLREAEQGEQVRSARCDLYTSSLNWRHSLRTLQKLVCFFFLLFTRNESAETLKEGRREREREKPSVENTTVEDKRKDEEHHTMGKSVYLLPYSDAYAVQAILFHLFFLHFTLRLTFDLKRSIPMLLSLIDSAMSLSSFTYSHIQLQERCIHSLLMPLLRFKSLQLDLPSCSHRTTYSSEQQSNLSASRWKDGNIFQRPPLLSHLLTHIALC